ncbi:MAG: NFACT family protein [Lachnospiraceae bacterium]|nr:NFACT family protein [Lachnospiraceae bacterium]
MAFDGITIANLTRDLARDLTGGRISRIAQPEPDELLLTIKTGREQRRLLMSASASLPLLYFTSKNKTAPATAPNFCMLLRKHIGNGRILSVTQPGLERIVRFEIEHLNEMGDLCRKFLIIELMGKYSNIIFTDTEDKIIDSIKHISANVSSVREVLPGRPYFIPDTVHKKDPMTVTEEVFLAEVCGQPQSVGKALSQSLTGISPMMGQEIAERAGADGDRPMQALSEAEKLHLFHTFSLLREDIREGRFSPRVIYRGEEPVEFSALPLTIYADCLQVEFPDISQVLETYYAEKSVLTRVRQRSADLRRIVQTTLERDMKKYDLQRRQMKDTEKREKYRIRGELIQTYGYSVEPGASSMTAENYYDEGKEITIPLDPMLTAQENAVKCFERYNKLKRTHEALTGLLAETAAEIDHLRSLQLALSIAGGEEDLAQIKAEMQEAGYIRKRFTRGAGKKAKTPASKPLHYVSPDGFHLYVGKNNLQNEELTFRFATGGDWWFHAKGIPGSHVIIKGDGRDLPDVLFEQAGALAAYYSSERQAEKVEIDYIQRKHVKKPAGTKPGYVIYHTNYSLMAEPARVRELQKIED